MTPAAPVSVRPPALRPGDEVMLVSPSGPVRPQRVQRGIELLSSWGLRVRVGAHAYQRNGYVAGDDHQRLADLNAALGDPQVRAVLCTRGGYGAQRIADGLDLAAVRADPKPLVGFSDITALQLVIWRAARAASLHAPMAAWNDERLTAASAQSLRSALTSIDPVVIRTEPTELTARVCIAGPPVDGVLLGGNLCLLAASIGTPDWPDLDGAILLLEEVDEAPYRIDRMLVQLRRAGLLRGLVGVALGQFVNCSGTGSIVDVLGEFFADLGVPVLGGLPIGHGPGQLTVPVGVPARLDVAASTLTASAGVS
jgi:muramoyltetrapeptide carboxypeptidase